MQEPLQSESLVELRRLKRLEERRKRKLHIRIVLVVLLIIAVLSAILIFRSCSRKKGAAAPVDTSAEPSQSVMAEIPAEPDTVIHIAAVGDIMIHDDLLTDTHRETGGYDFTENFAAVSAYTVSADLTLGNLELNFCGEPYCGKPSYRAPESLAMTLAGLGFDVLQTANSCSIQNGLTGLESTIRVLDAAGIDHVGTYASPEEKAENAGVLLRTVSGVKVAILGYTKGLNGLSLPEGSEYAVNLLYTDYATDFSKIAEASLLRDLEAAKALSPDIIIAMLHWGSEADRAVTKTQEAITTLLFENGVDAIIGSHSHLAGPMETQTVTTVDGKEKTCFVAYSLGNFFSGMNSSLAYGCEESVILDLQFTKNGETGDCALSGISYTPIYLSDQGEEAQPRFLVLPIRSAIISGLFPDLNQTLTDAIAHLRTSTDSDFDSGR